MEPLDTFLAKQPPFDELTGEQIAAAGANAREVRLEPGESVLVEDGAPAPGLYVVLSGAMELVHEGETVQSIGPGECFGHPSLLTGMAPAFTVRAREGSVCALLAERASREVLATDAGVRYVARTMRTRLTRTGDTVHALLDVGTTPVSAIMRPAAFCEPTETLGSVAARLAASGGAVLVRQAEESLAILTEADVAEWVGAGGGSVDVPVGTIARSPAPSVPAGQLAVEATVDMMAAGAEHVAVIEAGTVCGMLSAADLLGLDVRSPIALRHTILGAGNEDVLARAAGSLPRLFRLLLDAGVPSRDIGRVLSLQLDAMTSRLIDFSISRLGPAPVPWVWLDLGSAARREFTLCSDQDNALAYATPSPDVAVEVDRYFEQLGKEVNGGLARCGFGTDNNGVLAGSPQWRMSKAAWLRTFDECLEEPDESHLIRATVAFDFRAAAGGLTIASQLMERIRAARSHPAFMQLLARTATGFPVALGRTGGLAVERRGEDSGRLDIKRGAITPLVNLVRFHAMANGVTISPTLDRIEAVASVGGLERSAAEGLTEAFTVIARVRLERHAACIADGRPPDNLIDPQELSPIARVELREALRTVRRGQRALGAWTSPGK